MNNNYEDVNTRIENLENRIASIDEILNRISTDKLNYKEKIVKKCKREQVKWNVVDSRYHYAFVCKESLGNIVLSTKKELDWNMNSIICGNLRPTNPNEKYVIDGPDFLLNRYDCEKYIWSLAPPWANYHTSSNRCFGIWWENNPSLISTDDCFEWQADGKSKRTDHIISSDPWWNSWRQKPCRVH